MHTRHMNTHIHTYTHTRDIIRIRERPQTCTRTHQDTGGAQTRARHPCEEGALCHRASPTPLICGVFSCVRGCVHLRARACVRACMLVLPEAVMAVRLVRNAEGQQGLLRGKRMGRSSRRRRGRGRRASPYFSEHGPCSQRLRAGRAAGIERRRRGMDCADETRANTGNLREHDRSLGEALPGYQAISAALELLHSALACRARPWWAQATARASAGPGWARAAHSTRRRHAARARTGRAAAGTAHARRSSSACRSSCTLDVLSMGRSGKSAAKKRRLLAISTAGASMCWFRGVHTLFCSGLRAC